MRTVGTTSRGVRCPVIPPCNDSEEEMHAIGRFLTEKNGK